MKVRALITGSAVFVCVAALSAQTPVTPPANKYAPADDVKIGQEAASEVRQQLPILKDNAVDSYVENLGRRLVAAIGPNHRHAEFRYTFDVVNVRELNAFALPGGPMFVHRGMIEAARTEGELAGVLAHELSHVVLRHGTAQASRATPFQLGQIAGAVLGAIVGGRTGSAIAQGTSFGLGAYFMKYGREYEKQADLEGAHIMARAGYDPRDMANMFRTIERESGGGGPEWLSDHPNPSNRSQYIAKEATILRVTNPVRDTRAFAQVRTRLAGMPQAPTTEEAARSARRDTGRRPVGTSASVPGGRVEPPSARYVQYNAANVFQVSVPSNWRELPASNAVTFAPEGAFGSLDGQPVFTHGVEMGLARSRARDLRTATDALLRSLGESNPRMSRPQGYRNVAVGGRRGLQTSVSNVSEATGMNETIRVVTTFMQDGTLFYAIAVAPSNEYSAYQTAFNRVVQSIRF